MIKQINSKDNQLYKEFYKLKAKPDRKSRRFLIEGSKLVDEAISSGLTIEYIVISELSLGKHELEKIQGYKVVQLSESLFNKISDDASSEGIIAQVVMDFPKNEIGSLVLYLDEVQNPGNAGTLIRSAAACGFDCVIFSKGSTNPYSSKVARASMGSLFKVDIHTAFDISELKEEGYSLIAADMDGVNVFSEFSLPDRAALVLGNEGSGISEKVESLLDMKVSIPMKNGVESLNVGSAGTVLMYQLALKSGRF